MKISSAFYDYRHQKIQCGGCSLRTYQNAENVERIVLQYFGDLNIKKIGPEQISDFYADLTTNQFRQTGKKRPVAKSTARNYVMTLRAVIRFHHKRGVKTCNPEDIEVPKREKKYARFIDVDQYDRLIEVVSKPKKGYSRVNRQRNEVIFKMLFYTGLRISELCALNRDSINNREFVVVGKSKKPRPCFITKEIEQDIERYLSMRDDDNPALFIANETGKRITPNNIQRVFRLATKKAGLTKVTPHTMRHSFATRMLEEGVDIRYVAELLGHQDLNTTEQYTHIKNGALKQIYENVLESA